VGEVLVECAGAGLAVGVVDAGDLVDVVADAEDLGAQGREFIDGLVQLAVGAEGGQVAACGGQAGVSEEPCGGRKAGSCSLAWGSATADCTTLATPQERSC
jgi:hypothetical protein